MSRIETERLVLSLYRDEDEEHLVRLLTDPAVMKYVDKGVMTRVQAKTLWQRLMHRWYPTGVDTIWAVTAKDDGRYVGNASLRPRPEKQSDWEIGYYLTTPEWGKGFASEAAIRLVSYGFNEMGLREIFATVDIENAGSRRVLEKAGLEHFSDEYDEMGRFLVYRIVRSD